MTERNRESLIAARYEEALRAILAVRLDTTPGVTTERAIAKARVEMRRIATEALGGATEGRSHGF